MTAPVTPDSLALTDDLLDAVVIGGGAAGLNGALMLARSRRSVVVIDSGDPRNAPAEGIHALLGNEGTPPAEYLERGRAEAAPVRRRHRSRHGHICPRRGAVGRRGPALHR